MKKKNKKNAATPQKQKTGKAKGGKKKSLPKREKKEVKITTEPKPYTRKQAIADFKKDQREIKAEKTQARKDLHAAAQRAYKARKQFAAAKNNTERNKAEKKIWEANAKAAEIRAKNNIGERKSGIQKKARDRSKSAKGTIIDYQFYQANDLRKNIAENFKNKTVKSVNGILLSSNPVKAMAELNSLLHGIRNYQQVRSITTPDGDMNVFLIGDEEDEDEEDENEDE